MNSARRPAASSGPPAFPVLLFNVEDDVVAGRLERALTRQGYRVTVERSAPGVAGDPAATYDAVLVTSRQPVETAVADARRRCPHANAVSTIVVDGVVIAQPFEAAPQSAAPQLARIRALAATVRSVVGTA